MCKQSGYLDNSISLLLIKNLHGDPQRSHNLPRDLGGETQS